MTVEEVIEHFIKEKKIVKVKENNYVLLDKTTILKESKQCINLPDKYKGVSITKLYDYFLTDCEIPTNCKISLANGKETLYLLRTKSKESETILKREILENPDIDFLKLVTNIKVYYKNQTTTKYPMAKFLSMGLWKGFLNQTLKEEVKLENTKMM
jgi:hypothetical protein